MSRESIFLPKLTADPNDVQIQLRELRGRDKGVVFKKLTTSGRMKEKRLFVDALETRMFYTPSKKDFAHSCFEFKEIRKVEPELPSGIAQKFRLPQDEYPIYIERSNGAHLALSLGPQERRDLLLQTIVFLTRRVQTCADQDPRKVRCYDLWLRADENGDRVLRFSELESLMFNLNIALPSNVLSKEFQRVDADRNGYLSFAEFTKFYDYLTTRLELRPLFVAYCDAETDTIDGNGIIRFFQEVQGEAIDAAVAKSLISVYREDPKAKSLCFREFNDFLLDTTTNGWENPICARPTQDMTQPLHHYYIASSHNTWLSGNQLSSKATLEAIKVALLSGARCIELECWDGAGEDPLVYHGYTKTTRLRYRDVLMVIRDCAFSNNPYPVILCLEINTSAVQGAIVSALTRSVLGYQLFVPQDPNDRMPPSKWCPNELLRKVLLKWRTSDSGPLDVKADKDSSILSGRKGSSRSQLQESLPDVSRIVSIAGEVPSAADGGPPSRMATIAESEGTSATQDSLRNVTSSMLVRTYPGAARTNSSNYNPFHAWQHGVQCAALNYQTWDQWMRAHDAMFSLNGRCGYVLKPTHLRTRTAPLPTTPHTLRVVVILGSHLPKPKGHEKGEIIDPYVLIKLRGSQRDEAANPVMQTKVVDDNGFSPYWNETFDLRIVDLDLAVLTLRVMDKDIISDDGVGEASVAIPALRLGYRAVPLLSMDVAKSLGIAKLFCHFSFVSAAPDQGGAAPPTG